MYIVFSCQSGPSGPMCESNVNMNMSIGELATKDVGDDVLEMGHSDMRICR